MTISVTAAASAATRNCSLAFSSVGMNQTDRGTGADTAVGRRREKTSIVAEKCWMTRKHLSLTERLVFLAGVASLITVLGGTAGASRNAATASRALRKVR